MLTGRGSDRFLQISQIADPFAKYDCINETNLNWMTHCTSRHFLGFYGNLLLLASAKNEEFIGRKWGVAHNCTKLKEELTKQDCNGKEPERAGVVAAVAHESQLRLVITPCFFDPNRRLLCFVPQRLQQDVLTLASWNHLTLPSLVTLLLFFSLPSLPWKSLCLLVSLWISKNTNSQT